MNGRVSDIAGRSVAGADILVYQNGIAVSKMAVSADDGTFSLALEAATDYVLRIITDGFAAQSLPVTSPTKDGAIDVTATILPIGDVITLSADGLETQAGADGASVTVSKSDFVTADGQPIIGDIALTITPVDVSDRAEVAAFPGRFAGIIEGETESTEIISLGAVEFEFTHNGEKVNLAPGATAEILIPVYVDRYQDGSAVSVGDTIPLWSLDENTGIWVQEGEGEVVASTASKTGLAMRATVSHFSWWNCDLIAEVAYVEVTVLGAELGDALVSAKAKSLVNWATALTTVEVGITTDLLRIPANVNVCFSADVTYDSGLTAIAAEKCVTAQPGEQRAIELTSPPAGEVDIVTQPTDAAPDDLKMFTVVNEAVQPVLISTITAESFVTFRVSEGSLPDGLSLLITHGTRARIVGVATEVGTYSFTVTAKDADGFEDSVVITYLVRENVSDEINLSFSETDTMTLYIGIWSGTATVDWNDGSPAEVISRNTFLVHEYPGAREGNVTITYSDGLGAARLLAERRNTQSYATFNFDVAVLSDLVNLEVLDFDWLGGSNLTGDFSSLPSSLKELTIRSTSGATVSGAPQDLPPNLTHLELESGSPGLVGEVVRLPRTLQRLRLDRGQALTGSLADFPRSLVHLSLNRTQSVVSGDLNDLPPELNHLWLASGGSFTLNGNVAVLPEGLTTFRLQSSGELTGSVATLPKDMQSFAIRGANELSGDIGRLPLSLTYFSLDGENSNMLTGNIADMPKSIRHFYLYGDNRVTGNVENLSPDMIEIRLGGQNTVNGTIESLPEQLINIEFAGLNTLSGDLGLLKANNLYSLILSGKNTIDEFSGAPVWNPTRALNIVLTSGGSSGFDSIEVDRVLQHLNANLPEAKNRKIEIRRTNDAARTSASDEAVLGLEEKGYSVLTKE